MHLIECVHLVRRPETTFCSRIRIYPLSKLGHISAEFCCSSFRLCRLHNLVPRACDPREGTRGSGIIRCRKPGILAKIELRIPFQRPI